MKEMKAADVSRAVDGHLVADGNIMVRSVSTDSRTLEPGCLFVAIRGERFDGHNYIREALDKGAALVMAEKGASIPDGVPAVLVEDTLKALGRLAEYHRSRFDIPVVAVTGSVGKTSTKEMIAATLSAKFRVHKTKGNFNNEIGLPLSVLELDDSHQAAVFEMGMRGFGEIDYLSRIVRPDIAIITNIGISHIERLGSRQNILKAKLEIIHWLKDDGHVILNGDDELLSGLRGLLEQKTLFYGMDESCDVRATDLLSKGEEGVSFSVRYRNREHRYFVPAPGIHNVQNALAAISTALVLGFDDETIEKGLLEYSGDRMRMNITETDGIKVINDAYNAAPASVSSALRVLCEIGANRRKWAVLGDMLELGDWAEDAHREIGMQVAEAGIDYLVGVGDLARWYVEGALDHGMPLENTRLFQDADDARSYISQRIARGDVILFKGSRKMNLDVLAAKLFEGRASGSQDT
ncbi:MAG: UDP-N-acetylmuramoyl-tripeptide--D-alanyl-D-alanine ligase [Clostridiaceae bacterium]|nr:UDP-N-acetylmuramoyl-tripeptide--D-alanyl-D-alanine ligase [Clostridiaceae bacterium]